MADNTTSDFSTADLDSTCSPCQDFYQFATGGWIARNPVPADRSSWGSYSAVSEQNRAELRELLFDMADSRPSAAPGSAARKLGVLFACCMDSARVEDEGMAPIRGQLDRIASVDDLDALISELGRLYLIGLDVPFTLSAVADPDDATRRSATISQHGIVLPVRDWYLDPSDAAIGLRIEYAAIMAQAFRLTGLDDASATRAAEEALALETALAGASMSRTQRRDPRATTNRMTPSELRALTPHLSWDQYFGSVGQVMPTKVIVQQPDYLRAVDSLLTSAPLEQWKAYLSWWLLFRASRFLHEEAARIQPSVRALYSGSATTRPRVRMCEGIADFALGQQLGQLWAERVFPPEAKAYAERLVSEIQAVLADRIRELDWMDPDTKAEALRKLERLDVRIGYPDHVPDHEGLRLVEDTPLLDMVIAVSRFRAMRELGRIDHPVDEREWLMLPQSISAGYAATLNAIWYPAAKFRPPFFALDRAHALNYGAIGATIAHEITHALDDEGRQYDADGNLRDWWTTTDAGRFEAAAEGLVTQFDGYVVLDSLRVDGSLTLGENIADLGGVTLAHSAWRRSGEDTLESSGSMMFSSEQLFFLAWAQNWRESIRPEALQSSLDRDVHAPHRWRVNGPLSNLPAFAEAFGCTDGDSMVRPDSVRVRIW
jgi:putative endopeptidase